MLDHVRREARQLHVRQLVETVEESDEEHDYNGSDDDDDDSDDNGSPAGFWDEFQSTLARTEREVLSFSPGGCDYILADGRRQHAVEIPVGSAEVEL